MHAKNARLAAALGYARRGWYVLPVYSIREGRCTCGDSNCRRPGKHPCSSHGVKDATLDPAVIRLWWTNWPDANIGIATGTNSGIVVIDVDPRNGGAKRLKELEANHGSLRDTTTSVTGGGGRHFIYAHPGFPLRKNALGPGIDVMSDGQYVVVPPSIHASGRAYSWLAGHGFDQKPPQQLPAAYQDLLRLTAVTRVASSSAPVDPVTITAGHRNTTLTSLGGKLRRSGVGEAAIRAALLAENANFQAPLDRSEVERIVASLLRYQGGPATGGDESFELV